MSEEIKFCPDCGNDMRFHGLGCAYGKLQPLREQIAELQEENEKLKSDYEQICVWGRTAWNRIEKARQALIGGVE